jgi:hypothetical protein
LKGWRRLVVLPKLQLLHLFFDQKKIGLGQQVKISLESHIPIFRRPPLHIVQSGRQQVGVDVLSFFQNDFRLYLNPKWPIGVALILPDRRVVLKERCGGRDGGGEFTLVGNVIKYAVAVSDTLNLAPVLWLQTQ